MKPLELTKREYFAFEFTKIFLKPEFSPVGPVIQNSMDLFKENARDAIKQADELIKALGEK